MTASEPAASRILRIALDERDLTGWRNNDPLTENWPVVYTLTGQNSVYVGETNGMFRRATQHLKDPHKAGLNQAVVIVDPHFNKSTCRDMESTLIRYFSGDGKFQVRNRNAGIVNDDYYDRAWYLIRFEEIFEQLRDLGLFDASMAQIEQSDLFKFSPFKALTPDQGVAVSSILESLLSDLRVRQSADPKYASPPSVVRGDPGTGKTIVAIFLMKLISDIKNCTDAIQPEVTSSGLGDQPLEQSDRDELFAQYFTAANAALLAEVSIGLVIPQQSLRDSVKKVFKKTPGLEPSWVISPYDVGKAQHRFGILIVDESHRLNQRANQASAMQNTDFRDINVRLYDNDDFSHTQLDWIRTQSDHQVFMLDTGQAVRPADLPEETTLALLREADSADHAFRLRTQMRVSGGADYITYVRDVFSGHASTAQIPQGYELGFFEDLGEMAEAIKTKNAEDGLARLVAGYGWPWRSKHDPSAYDIEVEGTHLRWNQTAKDWINSRTSPDEVGSIHTVQGYDLNWAGVIVGPELRYDRRHQRMVFDREKYFDKKGMQNNRQLGITYSNEEILQYIVNIYVVLATRGMKGTFVYVADEALREHLRPYFAAATPTSMQTHPDMES